jgi:hypothetical protein
LPEDNITLVQMVGATAEELEQLRNVFDEVKNETNGFIIVSKEINVSSIPWQSNVAP